MNFAFLLTLIYFSINSLIPSWLNLPLLIILVLIGLVIIVLIKLFIVLIPAIIVAAIVYFFTGSLFLAGIAFVVVALLSIIAKI